MQSITVAAFLAVVASASAVSLLSVTLEEFEAFKVEHAKKYDTDVEAQFRMKIYMENKHKIDKHNFLYHSGQKKYRLKMNKYGDLLHQEFISIMNGWQGNNTREFYKENHLRHGPTFIESDDDILLPKNIDWREKGAVTPVKDQGQLGQSWTYSATGALEGQHFLKTGDLVSLSEKNLADCCNCWPSVDNAFTYVKDNHGIDTAEGYPKDCQSGTCCYNPDESGANCTGFIDILEGSEDALKDAIATKGPVSVLIDASHESFQFYRSGVYADPECTADNLDHAVLAVGYGITEDGDDYWLVKNSWGTTWGDQGYVKIARNQDNMCGIASAASFPLV